MMNFKQKDLIENLLQVVKSKFPEVQLLNITESPEDPNDLWVNITAPADEDREIALLEFASEKEFDILESYGYQITLMPTRNHLAASVA
ncbi:MAG: hypothetical protein AAB354_08970 [candidate division KSB1 bacterium]